MSQSDFDYYQRRAAHVIVHAQQARHFRVVQAHYQLASAYLDRIHGDLPKSTNNIFRG